MACDLRGGKSRSAGTYAESSVRGASAGGENVGMVRSSQPNQPDERPAKLPIPKAKDSRPAFNDDEMRRPIRDFREYPIEDYRKLPNALEVIAACVAVPFKGKTEVQYKDALSSEANRPCRIEMELIDINANYDFATFKLLNDKGKSGLPELKQFGDLGNYTRYLKAEFTINEAKKKGLDARKRTVGDRIVLVGLGYIVAAGPWSASTPTKGMPRGDERQVMLRAFGKPNNYRSSEYEFSFMVRNWYFAAQ